MARVGYDVSVPRGGGLCGYGSDDGPISEGAPLGVFGHRCGAPTDGLYVYLPFGLDQFVRVNVCPQHIWVLWKAFGEPRGEPEWLVDWEIHGIDE